MTLCNRCGGLLKVGPSVFPGWNLFACEDCERPVKLIGVRTPRLPGTRKLGKADVNRALRAARRQKMSQ